ncbi:MAG: signal recognition particle-docking protein FtsY [Candidatus Woesearchaeota archaeon]
MFGFLKDKLKGALGKFSKEVEKDAVIEKKEVVIEKKHEKIQETKNITKEDIPRIVEEKKPGFFQRIFGRKEEEEIIEEKEELRERAEKIIIEPEQKIEKQKEIKKSKIQEPLKEKATVTEKIIEVKEIESKIETPIKKAEPEILENKTSIREQKTDIVESEVKEKESKIETPIKKAEPEISKPHYQTVEEERAKKTVEQKDEEHKGFFTKITETFTKIQITEDKFEELFWELEVVLLENNVAVEVIDKIKRDLKKELMSGKVSRKGIEELIISTLKQSIIELFDVEKIDLINKIKERKKDGKPYIIAIIGVNGSGKTTSIAKLTHKFQKNGFSVVLAASDTFRAAAIQQLEEHANKLNVKMVKHDYNSDPAAVAYDAIKYAEAKNVDVVIIDTAGRLHSNTNLMRELEKVMRVCKPDIKIFVGESITGNDCVEQAKEFDKVVGIDAIILAKADVDDKGGAAISVSYILQRPILYLGTGQTYDDLKEFNPKIIIESLEL